MHIAMKNTDVLIIGGGTGGIMLGSRLRKMDSRLSITIIEPAETHYYQPAWTLVGAGTYNMKKTSRPMADVMPKGIDWIKDHATGLSPSNNLVHTKSSGDIEYEMLVVSPGLINAPELLDGLQEAFDKGVACSNYIDPEETWRQLKAFKGGNALFTQPTTPIKCGGAPQKMAYMAADYLERHNLKDKSNVIFATPGSVIFGIEPVRQNLEKVIKRYGIHFKPHYAPVKVDADKKSVFFKFNGEGSPDIVSQNVLDEKLTDDNLIEVPFDFLHLAPPQKSPDFVAKSELANEKGWLDVNIHTLQHKRFPNVFGLGDVADLPTAKTGAAIRKQVPVVAENILGLFYKGDISKLKYNGYSSCPLVTGFGKMILAEFDYEGNFTPDPKLKYMLIGDSSEEHWRLWMLKKYGLPYLYWNKMLKGAAV